MTHDPKALQDLMVAAAPPEAELSFRAMFGGVMAYSAGKPFASLSNVGLALKAGKETREALLAVAGSNPLRYAPDAPVSKTYVLVPPAMHNDRTVLRDWIKRSMADIAASGTKSPKGRP